MAQATAQETRGRIRVPGLRARSRRSSSQTSPLWALVFLGANSAGLLIFYVWPTIRTFVLSFTRTGPFGGSEWVGLDNYIKLFQDPSLLGAMKNTAIYSMIVLLGIPISLFIAVLLNTNGLRGRGFYRTLYFIPVVTMPAAVAIVWKMIYNGDYGILNQALSLVGIEGRSWLTDSDAALYAIAAVGLWGALGTSIVIFLAGLQGIPTEIMEAASLDGATATRKFFSITLPLISPSMFFVAVVQVITAMQVFDVVYMMLGKNNPALSDTRTIVFLFYEAGFIDRDAGYAAAIACFLLVLIMALTAIQFRLQKKWVHYE